MSEGSRPALDDNEPREPTSSRRKVMESEATPEEASSRPTCSSGRGEPKRRKRDAKVKAEETSTKSRAQDRDCRDM
eukprot:669233-Prorocentrum_lima.AAC.1